MSDIILFKYTKLDQRYIKTDGTNAMNSNLTFNSGGIITPDYLRLDTTYTPTGSEAIGTMYWNDTDGTADLKLSPTVTMQIGQELPIKVYNDTGAQIDDGTPVYIAGRQGHVPKIAKAQSNSMTTGQVLGLVTSDVPDKQYGYVTTFGYVRQIKTNYTGTGDWGTTWAENDKLYVSKTVAGQLTNVEPTAPHHSDVVGIVAVVGAVGTGAIQVNIVNHKMLEQLSDVDGSAPDATGDLLTWNQTNSVWERNAYNITDYLTTSSASSLYIKKSPTAIEDNLITIGTATYKGLVIKNHASQSANPFEVQNSSGTVLGYFDGNGKFNVGGTKPAIYPNSTSYIRAGNTNDTSSITYIQALGLSSVDSASDVSALSLNATTGGTGKNAYGINATAYDDIISFSHVANEIKGIVFGAYSFMGATTVIGADFQTYGGVTNIGGKFTVQGTGSTTNIYGTLIDASGATNNYGIQSTASGTNSISGYFISGSATTFPLVVKAHASQSANLTEWRNSSGTVISRFSSSGFLRLGDSSASTSHLLRLKSSSLGADKYIGLEHNSSSIYSQIYLDSAEDMILRSYYNMNIYTQNTRQTFIFTNDGSASTMKAISNNLAYQWYRTDTGANQVSFLGENTEGTTTYGAFAGHHGATNNNARFIVNYQTGIGGSPVGIGFLVSLGTSDVVQHVTRGYSTQTNYLHTYQLSTATVVSGVTGTGEFKGAVGSVSSAGLGFYGDDDTGFYWSSANKFSVAVGGSQLAYFEANKVMLGQGDSGTPVALSVSGASASGGNVAGADITFEASNGTGSGTSGDFIFKTAGALTGTGTPTAVSTSKSTAVSGSVASLTFSHTVPTANQKVLVVGILVRNSSSQTISTVTYGGVSLTLLSTVSNGTNTRNEIWYLKEPTVGTANIVVTPSASALMGAIATTFKDVDQTTTFGTPATATGSTTNATVNVSSGTLQTVFAVVSKLDSTEYPITAGASVTELGQDKSTNSTAGNNRVYATGTGVGATTVTMNWTWTVTGRQWAILGVSLLSGNNSVSDTLTERVRIRDTGQLKSTGRQVAVAIKSANYTLTNTDEVVVFTANATATLPAATGSGQTYRIVCRSGTLTIDANSSETVKGELTQTLTAGEDLIITDTASGIWE